MFVRFTWDFEVNNEMVPLKPDFFLHLEPGKAQESYWQLFWVRVLIGISWAATDTGSFYERRLPVPKGGPQSHPDHMGTALPELTTWADHQLGSSSFFFF